MRGACPRRRRRRPWVCVEFVVFHGVRGYGVGRPCPSQAPKGRPLPSVTPLQCRAQTGDRARSPTTRRHPSLLRVSSQVAPAWAGSCCCHLLPAVVRARQGAR